MAQNAIRTEKRSPSATLAGTLTDAENLEAKTK